MRGGGGGGERTERQGRKDLDRSSEKAAEREILTDAEGIPVLSLQAGPCASTGTPKRGNNQNN